MATAAKTKSSSLSETTPNSKPSTPSPRVSKVSSRVGGVTKSDADSPSPVQNPRISVDRSPRSVTSKPSIERKSSKLSTTPDVSKPARLSTTPDVSKPAKPSATPDKKATPPRALKTSELQAELNSVQEDLKKAKEKLSLLEKEKIQALDELKEAKKLADEANEKLSEALVAQKRAEENSEIEKFRAVEMEQAGIEAAQKKEDEWQKELEAVRNQHAVDVAALLSATQELQRVKQELAMINDAKKEALNHADDATKIAEMQAAKVETLSAEVVRLKSLLDSRMQTEADENAKLMAEMDLEIETLKQELEESKGYKEKLLEKESSLEQLNVELEAARMAESYAHSLVDEWKKRVEELELHSDETKRLERSASESLQSVMKQLEESNDSLHDAESEIATLREKVGLLEISIKRQRVDLDESERRLEMAKDEASNLEKEVASLTAEIETLKEEKIQALNNEKLAAESVQTLLEEKNKLITELENSKDEEEKSKKAMESLASALHEVSTEAREAKENLLSAQGEHGHYETQIEDLKLALKETNEKYKTLLDDAKQEIDVLTSSNEQSKQELQEHEKWKTEWDQKELQLMNSLKKIEEENSSMEKEISRLVNLHKEAADEAGATKEEEMRLKNLLKEAESEVTYLKEIIGEAKAESMNLKESLMDKESELQNILQENEELRNSEAASQKKIQELSELLEEALAKKQAKENGDLTDSEKDYDMLPKVVEFSEQNGGGSEEKAKIVLPTDHSEHPLEENIENGSHDEAIDAGNEKEATNGKLNQNEGHKEDDDSVEADSKMWESYKVGEKDFSPEGEAEQESFEEDLESKAEGSEAADEANGVSLTGNHENGGTSPSKQQSQKKKKPLLKKFGNLLKKKGSSNQKQ
ncbi:OLC1v1006041C1 [Oldenlandia corymbosa var. corymbosa]|uniref:OLC1v1006041C1 n=1 Tax=Oldenlandia corymbosa var. corymbosa TaxID=529605 RepID=A0AAV1DIQ5_OLDCO|nr:OLC1v1006041C1 [Oldenlandia corymbosa var. corymbosa]